MGVTIKELYASGAGSSGSNAKSELLFLIKGTDGAGAVLTDISARTYFLAYLNTEYPSGHGGMVLDSADIDVIDPLQGWWSGRANFKSPEKQKPEKPEGTRIIAFDTTGGTAHITQSISTQGRYGLEAGVAVKDYEGAIGVTSDSVEGCDIIAPVQKITIQQIKDAADITPTYIDQLEALTGKMNDSLLRMSGYPDYPQGDALYIGAQGQERGDGSTWELNHTLGISKSRANFLVGKILIMFKRGWDYLWVQYADAVSDTTQEVTVTHGTGAGAEVAGNYTRMAVDEKGLPAFRKDGGVYYLSSDGSNYYIGTDPIVANGSVTRFVKTGTQWAGDYVGYGGFAGGTSTAAEKADAAVAGDVGIVKKPVRAYVEQVYETDDLNSLGL